MSATEVISEGATMTEIREWLNARGVKNTRGQALTYNYQHGTQTIILKEVEGLLDSDLDCLETPK